MPSAFILGPSKWREEPKSAITVAPLDMRRHLAQISSSLGTPGIVMEDEEHRGEDFTTKFNFLDRDSLTAHGRAKPRAEGESA